MEITPTSPRELHVKIKSPSVAALRIVEDVVVFVELNHKWKHAVEKGSQLCKAIENIKKSSLQASSTERPYSENVILYCKKLLIIITIMEDIVKNAINAIMQIKSLKGYFSCTDVIGRTWNFDNTLKVMDMIIQSYKVEISFRRYIAENIGHAITNDQLALLVCSWNNLLDIECNRELRISMIALEFGKQ